MSYVRLVNALYEGASLAELDVIVSELAAEKAAEIVGPNSEEYENLVEKFEEGFRDVLASYGT